jgi:hypothetical protein
MADEKISVMPVCLGGSLDYESFQQSNYDEFQCDDCSKRMFNISYQNSTDEENTICQTCMRRNQFNGAHSEVTWKLRYHYSNQYIEDTLDNFLQILEGN